MEAVDLSDEELMRLFRIGKTEAFQVLFDKYKNRIFGFVHVAYERDPSSAEDCVQEIFLRVIKGRDTFNPAMRFSTWLFTIARNHCLNRLRDRSLHLEFHVAEPGDLACATTVEGADAALLDHELGETIRSALAALPENLRTVFVLREVDGLSHAEISDILNQKESNTRIQLHRAKKQLQELIAPYMEGKK